MSIRKSPAQGSATKRRKLSHSPTRTSATAGNLVSSTTPRPSNSFMMDQFVKELLVEVRPNYEVQHSRSAKTVENVMNLIQSCPDRPPHRAPEAEKSLRRSGVTIPFPDPRPDKSTQYQFEFQRPESVQVVGSAPLKLYLKGPRTVDVAVTMPASLLQQKDYLNYRAFHKRAYYLACLADTIKKEFGDDFALTYEYQDDIALLPALVLSATANSASEFSRSKSRIRILVVLPENSIPLDKTVPTKNCVRPSDGNTTTDTILKATPFYNSCLRSTASVQHYEAKIAHVVEQCPAFSDACRLGRVWLRQRDMTSSIVRGGFGLCEWTLLCALLFEAGGHKGRPLLSVRFSSLQIFKIMMHFLAERYLTQPLTVGSAGFDSEASDQPSVYDSATGVNILFKMTPWSYQSLRAMCSQSLAVINSNRSSAFHDTFISRIDDVFLRFDETISIDTSSLRSKTHAVTENLNILLDTHRFLRRGFGDRVQALTFESPAYGAWKISNLPTREDERINTINMHLLLNPDANTRYVDRGPSAEDTEAAADFRSFWGSKADLRRFKDGTISESLVWNEGFSITLQIAQHLLHTHLTIPVESVAMITDSKSLEAQVLPVPPANLTPSDTFRVIHKTYQDLSNILLQIKDLPLRIKTTAPVDEALNASALDLTFSKPVNMHIEFEDSPRWPDDLAAIEHTKATFLAKLADVLGESQPQLTTRAGIENQARSGVSVGHRYESLFNRSFLDVIYPSPGSGVPKIAFRIRILNTRTTHLLEKAAQEDHFSKASRDLISHAFAESTLPTRLAAHTVALRTLCSSYPTLSTTIRLLKKWTASHLLSSHIPSQLVELVAFAGLKIFQTNETPGSPTTGFLRALRLLAKWDWVNEPLSLCLDPNKSLGREESDRIASSFSQFRKSDPAMHQVAVVVGTNLDPSGVMWTQQLQLREAPMMPKGPGGEVKGISGVIMRRWCRLADHAVGVVAGWHGNASRGFEDGNLGPDWKSIFSSPLGDYDFVIHLKRHLVRKQKRLRSADAKFKNLELAASGVLGSTIEDENIGFAPVQLYLDDLETAFGTAALFFYDASGSGAVIAGLWRPDVLGRKKEHGGAKEEFKLGVGFSYPTMPMGRSAEEGRTELGINQASILSQIAQMGEGLVERVEKVKDFVVT